MKNPALRAGGGKLERAHETPCTQGTRQAGKGTQDTAHTGKQGCLRVEPTARNHGCR